MDMLRETTRNFFLRPLASLDDLVGLYVPKPLVQFVVNAILAKLATTALQLTGKWTFTRISDRTTSHLTSIFLNIALSLTNSARKEIGATPHQGSALSSGVSSNQPSPPVQNEKVRELYSLLIGPSSYCYIMNMRFSWGDLLATAKQIQENTGMTLPQVFNRLDSQGDSLPWTILNSIELEPDERYLIMKGLLENEADLPLYTIPRGFAALFNSDEIWRTNVNGSTTLFKLIQDGLLKDGALGKIKNLWNSKGNKQYILDFLKDQKRDFDTTIFDAETGELK